MTTTAKGSPVVTAKVNLVEFVLQNGRTIQFPPLGPQQYFQILVAVVRREKVHLRQLFPITLQEILDGKGWGSIAWLKVNGPLPALPPGLTLQTKCQPSNLITLSVDQKGNGKLSKYIIVTRNGGLFFFEHDVAGPGRIVPLTQKTFLNEFKEEYPRAIKEFLNSLERTFHKAHEPLRMRADTFAGEANWLSTVKYAAGNLSSER